MGIGLVWCILISRSSRARYDFSYRILGAGNMATASDKNVSLLMSQLQKSLKKIVTDLPQLESMEVESSKHVGSLVNLLGQRQALLSVWPGRVSYLAEKFPDLQAKMMVKISSEVDSKVEVLKALIHLLKEHHDLISRSRTEILRLLQKVCLDESTLHHGSPTTPPLQAMLDWLNTLEVELRELYYARLHYLDSILDPDVILPDNLTESWAQSGPLLDTLRDCAEQGKYFLDESR